MLGDLHVSCRYPESRIRLILNAGLCWNIQNLRIHRFNHMDTEQAQSHASQMGVAGIAFAQI